jgi:hypothetical protein
MWMLVNLAMLVLATLIAGAAAVEVYWLLLRVTLAMMGPAAMRPTAMRPAPVRSVPVRTELARGTAGLVRAFTPRPSVAIRSLEIQEGSK